MSDYPNDDRVLNPNHFLMGQTGGNFVPDTEPFNPRKRRRTESKIDERILTADWIKTEIVLP